ncbi:MAG: hypothetical protein AAF487_00295 [Bacteroidota bacterium]
MRTRLVFIGLFLSLGAMLNAQQCRSFVKKNCIGDLAPYTANETFNSAVLIPGDEAELNMTFYAGQEYRLFVCNDPILGEVDYKIYDSEKNEVYNSIEAGGGFFDFAMENTQQMIVEIAVPLERNPNKLIHQGCVAIMVGYKK